MSRVCPNGPQITSGGENSLLCFFMLLLSVEEGGDSKEKRESEATPGKRSEE